MGGTQNWGAGELGGRIWFVPTGGQRETSERIHCQERRHSEDGLEGEDGQLVRKGTRSLSPISLDPSDGAGRWVGCGRKRAPGAVMLVELSVFPLHVCHPHSRWACPLPLLGKGSL